MELLSWLENTDAVTWIRESTSLLGYTLYLSLHTLGLIFLLGPVVVIGLRMAGLAPKLPLAAMRSFFPLMVTGFCVNVVSGLVLFATAPVGFVRNVTFLVKLASVLVAIVALRRFLRHVFHADGGPEVAIGTRRARVLFGISVAFWTLAIAAGRLTAYSAYVISRTTGALLVALAIAVAAAVAVRAVALRRRVSDDAPVTLAPPLEGR
jgi:hypothetical protein